MNMEPSFPQLLMALTLLQAASSILLIGLPHLHPSAFHSMIFEGQARDPFV